MNRFATTLILMVGVSVVFGADQGVDPTAGPRLAAPTEAPAPKEFAHPEALVSTDALAKSIAAKEPKLLVIDARPEADYALGHIPGARSLPSDSLQDAAAPPYYMPTAEALKTLCVNLGIDADTHLAIYDEDDNRLAARVWFTFHARGHNNVALLNGGVGRWHDEQRSLVFDTPPVVKSGTFEPSETLRGVCGFDDLPQFRTRARELGKMPSVSMIDARSLSEYTGEDVRGKVGGHMPASANLEWSNVMTGHAHIRVWRSPPEIHAMLRMAGVDAAQKIAIYDQAGACSAHVYFTLWMMGFTQIFNYTGGWREYSKKDTIEIEK